MVLPVVLIDAVGFGAFGAGILCVTVLLHRLSGGIKLTSWQAIVAALGAIVILLLKAGAVLQFDIPDSAEYLGMASRLVYEKTFLLHLDARDLPSRYQPWFSWFLLYPLMRLWAAAASLAIVPPLCAILGGCATALLAGTILPPERRALAPAIGAGVVLVPAYLYFSGHLMTDIPATALTVLLAAVFCVGPVQAFPRGKLWCVGVVAALVFSMRPVGVLVLLPFLFEARRLIDRLIVLVAPTLVIGLASLWLNKTLFGDALRTGYNLWVAVPYDYIGRTFSLEFLGANLEVLVKDPVFIAFMIVGLWPLSRELRGRLKLDTCESRVRLFIAFALIPQMILHLVYFYPTIRFFLPLEVICGTLVACRIGCIVPMRVFSTTAMLIVLMLGVVGLRGARASFGHSTEEELRTLRQCAPDNAVLVSARHSVLNEELVIRDSGRKLVPLSRRTELASKVLVWKRVEAPAGIVIDPRDHRTQWLIQGGAEEAYPRVAVEHPEMLREALMSGRTVIFDRAGASVEDVRSLEQTFSFEPLCAEFIKLGLLTEDRR